MSYKKHSEERNILIRADAGPKIGTGHVMRCLALAQAWQETGGLVTFVTHSSLPQMLKARLRNEGMIVQYIDALPGSNDDSWNTLNFAQAIDATCIVVDGYTFGSQYQRLLKVAGYKVLFIDDNGQLDHYTADWVLNQNSYALPSIYRNRESHTQLLLGTRYTLLRREFWKWRGCQREVSSIAQNILVTMGGSDPDNVTGKILLVLNAVNNVNIDVSVAVGSSNPYYFELQDQVTKQHFRYHIGLEHNIIDIPTRMAWADLAISASGSTVWELAFMGTPAILLVTAENQRQIAAQMDSTMVLNEIEAIPQKVENLLRDANIRSTYLHDGRKLVDGYGVNRVVNVINGNSLQLRRATQADCRLIWEWANDPQVRAASFSQEPIPWEQHIAWFNDKLQAPNFALFIAELLKVDSQELIPVGICRFAVEETEATISLSLDSQYRHRGLGSNLICSGAQIIFQDYPSVNTISAYIKVENLASYYAFLKSGFYEEDIQKFQGQTAFKLIRQRKEYEPPND